MAATREHHDGQLLTAHPDGRASLFARLTASLLAGRFDRMLAVGAPATPGSAVAVHADRIVAYPHREALARTLRSAIRDSHDPRLAMMSSSLPVHRVNVAAAETTIDAITLWLHSPRPVTPRGMARLRLVLCDGAGPFYELGRGDLDGRLGAALAAM
jgi:hypothetical protein